MKMTREQYLSERGWLPDGSVNSGCWLRPEWSTDAQGNVVSVSTANAVQIQRAADAAEERRAWVAFAAGVASAESERWSGPMLATAADDLLNEFRQRFAVELAD